ncbi:WecB/TagA/CpsF family glycosyltransferase [Marimonas arenosa]|uniref:WecB/TagA/CpsF family glycosyltransferase n=1 Tax=Marimonas arenosa TaxID=1795305 RepID=A0AAE3WA23_9RHOB|nr:WecB/TagA/CpsF family glycosyltransferase [Marimonas arenosa]MDQ2089341.1 WecB/TagA/CpsF family glycosyltransferase [Marimonas arenosa]
MEFRISNQVIRVNVPDANALLAEVRARLRQGAGFALATINLDHLVKLRRSAIFRAAYDAQDLVVADGHPIVWLGWLAGRPLGLVPGSDMVLPLAEVAAEQGVKVALVGSTEASLAAAGAEMQRLIPGLEITAQIAPPMGFDPEGPAADAVLAELDQSDAGLVFLALGAPKQEILAARGRTTLPRVGFASIGAGLDFLSGTQTRAPAWVRAIAMEWAWRMLQNPRRLGWRYAKCFAILPVHGLRALGTRLSGR